MTFREKIEGGQFVICGETTPPKSPNASVVKKKSQHFNGFVDAVNVTDNQSAVVRMSSMVSSKLLLDEGLEPIMQMTCRDRNRLAIESDLIGASALGIDNLLCLTGDHQKFGDDPEARGVFDLDSIQLIAAVRQMNAGVLISGKAMKRPTNFFIGGAANPFATPMEIRVIKVQKKVDAGAHFIQTQPVFDLETFSKWMDMVVAEGLHEQVAILPGIMPVKSTLILEHMEANIPGMRIPQTCIDRFSQAEDVQEEGIRLAVETARELKKMKGVHGIHLLPVGWEKIVPSLVGELHSALDLNDSPS